MDQVIWQYSFLLFNFKCLNWPDVGDEHVEVLEDVLLVLVHLLPLVQVRHTHPGGSLKGQVVYISPKIISPFLFLQNDNSPRVHFQVPYELGEIKSCLYIKDLDLLTFSPFSSLSFFFPYVIFFHHISSQNCEMVFNYKYGKCIPLYTKINAILGSDAFSQCQW